MSYSFRVRAANKMAVWTQGPRKRPYTVLGMLRVRCVRCGERAVHQWQVCADGNNWRALCLQCDVALNRTVLEFMKHPKALQLMLEYERKTVERGTKGSHPFVIAQVRRLASTLTRICRQSSVPTTRTFHRSPLRNALTIAAESGNDSALAAEVSL